MVHCFAQERSLVYQILKVLKKENQDSYDNTFFYDLVNELVDYLIYVSIWKRKKKGGKREEENFFKKVTAQFTMYVGSKFYRVEK